MSVIQEYRNKINQIERLKTALSNLDYKTLKFVDGAMSAQEYEPVRIEKQNCRDRINALEADLEDLQQAYEQAEQESIANAKQQAVQKRLEVEAEKERRLQEVLAEEQAEADERAQIMRLMEEEENVPLEEGES